MKTIKCNCGRFLNFDEKKELQIYLSSHNCDVYGCTSATQNPETEWPWHASPQHPYSKCKNSSSISKNHKAGQNTSVVHFFFSALAKSSINGISNCTSSKSILGKLIWLVVFTICIMGFGYQTLHFYDLFKNKPSVVQIEVENDGEVDFPAVTLCTTNRFRKSTFCKYYPKKCLDYDNVTITEVEINDILYHLLLEKKTDRIKELGHSRRIFESCTFIGKPEVLEDECLKIWEDYYDPDYGNCFTFTGKNTDNIALQARKVDFWQEENDLTIIVDDEPEEFTEKRRSPGVLVVIHDNRALPDIHSEGIYLTAGSSYTITVAKTTVRLLPPPYKTNCTDYFKLPWQETKTKRLTSRMCTVGCSQYYQLENCKFVTENLSLFYEELPYEAKDVTKAKNCEETKELYERMTSNTEKNKDCAKEVEDNTIHYCRTVCGLPCKDTYFSATVASSRLSEIQVGSSLHHRELENNSIYEDIIHMRIFYSTLEHKIFRHIPKYDTMELFSFLGGYSGVWLGFSLLTVYELLEILVSTALFFFRKRERHKQNKKFLKTFWNTRKGSKTAVKTYKKKKNFR